MPPYLLHDGPLAARPAHSAEWQRQRLLEPVVGLAQGAPDRQHDLQGGAGAGGRVRAQRGCHVVQTLVPCGRRCEGEGGGEGEGGSVLVSSVTTVCTLKVGCML